jgi:hypothetical protein
MGRNVIYWRFLFNNFLGFTISRIDSSDFEMKETGYDLFFVFGVPLIGIVIGYTALLILRYFGRKYK